MKKINLTLAMFVVFMSAKAFAADLVTSYGIHLFFNETEYVDVLTITQNANGSITGLMEVPNDFTGEVNNLVIGEKTISFDLFVPKNPARPEDLIFHYEGQFFDASQNQVIGFVTLKDQTDFVASFTGFARPAGAQ
jgi:hypothetical protein